MDVSNKTDSGSPKKKDTIESLIAKPPIILKSSISQLRYLILVDGLSNTQPEVSVNCHRDYFGK